MIMEKFDYAKAQEMCREFLKVAQKNNADAETIFFASFSLFMGALTVVTNADPKTGRKYERMREMVPGLMDAYNKDFPIDKEE